MYGKSQDRAIGRTAILAGALAIALLIGGAGGYVLGTGAAATTSDAVTERASAQTGPASRWTHEEVPFEAIQLGRASRWTHEERDFVAIQLGPLPRITHEDAFPNP
jgi:hypothetical protein